MYAYCGNNPVNRHDSDGTFWKKVGDAFKSVGSSIVNLAKSTFGAESMVVHEVKQETELIPPVVNLLLTVKGGTKEREVVFSKGNSSKPISVYARGRSDKLLLSSAGLKINIASFSLNVSLGLDNLGIRGSFKKGETTNAFALKADLSQLKVGVEKSAIVNWDANSDVVTYTNASITGWGIVAICMLSTTGQWQPSPQPVY